MSIYVISNDINIEKNMFKVGRTKDTNTQIVTKYQRYLSGARLLLWYRSNLTNYIKDEREILRFFDSNRNRTPNGFKNEWLCIPFEQLKTKMDEYFGHDGEDFEEEQQRERETRQKEKDERRVEKEMTEFVCDFCSKQLSTKFNLSKHLQVCKKRINNERSQEFENIKEQHKKEIQALQQLLQNQLEEQQKQHETTIHMLNQKIKEQKEQIEKLEFQNIEYHNQIFEIAKKPLL
jgi:hypothetical protein